MGVEKNIIVTFGMDRGQWDELSHAICMGIRKGLFGKDASNDKIFEIDMSGLYEISKSIDGIAAVLSGFKQYTEE